MDKIKEYVAKADNESWWEREEQDLWKVNIPEKARNILGLSDEIWNDSSPENDEKLFSRLVTILEKNISDKLLETTGGKTHADDVKKIEDKNKRTEICNALRSIYKIGVTDRAKGNEITKKLYLSDIPYSVFAYLMFVSDEKSFAPLRPDAVRKAMISLYCRQDLKNMGLDEADSYYNYTNYEKYNRFIKQKIVPALKTIGRDNLLDGYNFLWIIRTEEWKT